MEPPLSYDPFESKENYGSRNYLLEGHVYKCCGLVQLFARFGLHRYNLLEGKNYEFISVKRYKYRGPLAITWYYITVVGKNRDDGSLQEFHTEVDEEMCGELMLTCCISRTRDDPDKVNHENTFDVEGKALPTWPRENPFEDTELYYMLTNSQLKDKNNDWIRMYLELAIATNDRRSKDHDLSNLKILKVATSHEDLSAKNATFYIRYRDPDSSRVGKDVDRVAVVQRYFDEKSKCFSLLGQNMSSDIILIHKQLYATNGKVIKKVKRLVKRKVLKDGNVSAITQGEQHKTLAKNKRGRKRKRGKQVLEFDTATKRERPAGYP